MSTKSIVQNITIAATGETTGTAVETTFLDTVINSFKVLFTGFGDSGANTATMNREVAYQSWIVAGTALLVGNYFGNKAGANGQPSWIGRVVGR